MPLFPFLSSSSSSPFSPRRLALPLLSSLSLLLLFLNRQYISNNINKLIYLPTVDIQAYEKLERIEAAAIVAKGSLGEVITVVNKYTNNNNNSNNNNSSSSSNSSSKEREIALAEVSKRISSLSADIDYILSELDQVRGGEMVKGKRRGLTEIVSEMGKEIDRLIERIEQEKKR